jgi:hypothetical protein
MNGVEDMAAGAHAETMRRRLCWLPTLAGAVVLSGCWVAVAVLIVVSGSACFLGELGLEPVARSLAFQFGTWDESGFGTVLACLIYAGLSLAPFLLLSGCVGLAARARTTLFLAVLALTGTVFVALYDLLGYWAAAFDIAHGGMFCDMAFHLVPFGGLIAGACAATVGSLAALLIEWRRRARSSSRA